MGHDPGITARNDGPGNAAYQEMQRAHALVLAQERRRARRPK